MSRLLTNEITWRLLVLVSFLQPAAHPLYAPREHVHIYLCMNDAHTQALSACNSRIYDILLTRRRLTSCFECIACRDRLILDAKKEKSVRPETTRCALFLCGIELIVAVAYQRSLCTYSTR